MKTKLLTWALTLKRTPYDFPVAGVIGLLVGIGADSFMRELSVTPEVATLLVTILTFYVIIRQLQLMERQDEIINRKANLVARVTYDETTNEFTFDAQNIGNRGVQHFSWHVWVPQSLGTALQFNDIHGGIILPSSTDDLGGENYFHYKGTFAENIYSTRAKTFATLRLPTRLITGELKFPFQIACEDGVFPKEVGDTPLLITI